MNDDIEQQLSDASKKQSLLQSGDLSWLKAHCPPTDSVGYVVVNGVPCLILQDEFIYER